MRSTVGKTWRGAKDQTVANNQKIKSMYGRKNKVTETDGENSHA